MRDCPEGGGGGRRGGGDRSCYNCGKYGLKSSLKNGRNNSKFKAISSVTARKCAAERPEHRGEAKRLMKQSVE